MNVLIAENALFKYCNFTLGKGNSLLSEDMALRAAHI